MWGGPSAGAMEEPGRGAIELFVREAGQGAPIVLLHGVGANHAIWNGVIPHLATEFHVLAPDLPGHGRSPAPEPPLYGFGEMTADLLHLLDGRGVRAAHWVGLSAGALLALRLCLDAPARARSLTTIGGSVYTDGHSRAVAERWAETYAREGPDAFAVRLLKDLYYPDWIEAHMEFADRLREEVPRVDYGPARAWARAVAGFDERSRVASLVPPALIVQGMDDQVVDASHGRILRQSIPGSQIRIFASTGHMVPVERPGETAEAIAAFVRAVEAGAAAGGPP